MRDIWNILNQNYIGLFLSVLGILLGYMFYRRALPRPKLAFQKASSRFPSKGTELPNDVEITFRGQRIPHLVKTTVAVWNCGNITLNGTQIVEKEPLRIVLGKESEILDVSVLSSTKTANDFRVSKISSTDVGCDFDYLDPRDGALITILHTNNEPISIEGTIRGLPRGVTDLGELMLYRAPKMGQFFLAIFAVISGIGLLLNAILFVFAWQWGEISKVFADWRLWASIVFCALILWVSLSIYLPNRTHPALTSNLLIPEDL